MQIEGYLDFKWVRLTKEKYNTETKFASKPNDRQVVEAKCKKGDEQIRTQCYFMIYNGIHIALIRI